MRCGQHAPPCNHENQHLTPTYSTQPPTHPPTWVVDPQEICLHEAEHHLTGRLIQEARLPAAVLCGVVLHLVLLLPLLLLAVWLLLLALLRVVRLLLLLLLAGAAASAAATTAATPAPVLLLPPPAAPLLAVALIALLLVYNLVQAHAQACRLRHRCCLCEPEAV